MTPQEQAVRAAAEAVARAEAMRRRTQYELQRHGRAGQVTTEQFRTARQALPQGGEVVES